MTKRWGIAAAGLVLVVAATGAIVLSAAPAARADDLKYFDKDPTKRDSHAVDLYESCGRFWPSQGRFETLDPSTGLTDYQVTFAFMLTPAELKALVCVQKRDGADYLEIDFRLFGFNLAREWEDYTVSANIPDGVRDVAAMDSTPTPAVTGIHVTSLKANVEYKATISFTAKPSPGSHPTVSIQWEPSRWARNPAEQGLCKLHLNNPGWCVFGAVRVFMSYGVLDGQTMPFDGLRVVTFNPAGSHSDSGGPGTGTLPGGHGAAAKVELAKGAANGTGYRYAVTLSGFAAAADVSVTCFDSVSKGGFFTFTLHTDQAGRASTSNQCFSADGPEHWVKAGGVESNHVTWGPTAPRQPDPPPPAQPDTPSALPAVLLARGPAAPVGYRYAITLQHFAPNSTVSVNCYDSVSPGGFYPFTMRTDGSGNASTSSQCYSGDGPDHWVVAAGHSSNHVQWGAAQPPPPPPATRAETVGGVTHTWTNYTNAGGTQGATIPAYTTVHVSCKLTGFRVSDGNTWWYRIASSPWNNNFYASADAFYNNGATSGPLRGTPFVDDAVPSC